MVTKIEYLQKLKELNLLSTGIKIGIIPISESRNLELLTYYEAELILQSRTDFKDYKAMALTNTATYFRLSEPQVYRIVRDLKR